MARKRHSITETQFTDELIAAGASPQVAAFVWSEVQPYYFKPLTPAPNDRWESTMRIDPEDLSDITEKYWKEQSWEQPATENPVQLPADPSLLEYALWLDDQRKFHQ